MRLGLRASDKNQQSDASVASKSGALGAAALPPSKSRCSQFFLYVLSLPNGAVQHESRRCMAKRGAQADFATTFAMLVIVLGGSTLCTSLAITTRPDT